MFQELTGFLQIPPLFASSTARMWNDPYISQQMLQAHLNPNHDAASRKPSFIAKSIDWIDGQLQKGSHVLDLGCGPGLYTTELAKRGHEVVGLDVSKSSIDYAQKSAQDNGLNIRYIEQNYLELVEESTYDVVLLIYCDFGVLSYENQTLLLQKIHRALKPSGRLILDVWTDAYFGNYKTSKNWKQVKSGFWRPHPYILIEESIKYSDKKVILEQHVVLDDLGIECYRNWTTCYSPKRISELLRQNGFEDREFFNDVIGTPCNYSADTFGIVATKKEKQD